MARVDTDILIVDEIQDPALLIGETLPIANLLK
jgi:hypothetical protein